jgi:hypothetical protein
METVGRAAHALTARHTERDNKKYIFAAGLAIARDVRAESGEGFKPFQAAYNVAPGGSVPRFPPLALPALVGCRDRSEIC